MPALVGAVCLLAVVAGNASEKVSAISRMRIRKITEIIRRYQQAGENLGDPDVKAAIFQEIAENYPLEPQGNPNRTSTRDIAKIIREKVAEKYPDDLKTIEAKALTEAESRFNMHNLLDYVFVRYEQGRKNFEAEGVFYSYGAGGNSINVGGQIIPIFDLLPEYRAKFDRGFNEIQKKEFIQERIRNYFRLKTQYSGGLFSEIREQIAQENERDGWIHAWNDWRTPKDVAEQIIRGVIAHAELPPDDPPPVTPSPDTPATPDIPGEEPATPADSLQARIAETKRRAEQRKIIIANTFTGVDADQGYGLALWSMTREEVALLFHPEIAAAGGAMAELKFEQGAIEAVQLFFLNDILHRVVVNFRIAHEEAMQLIWRRIEESYGESREEQAERQIYEQLKARADAIAQSLDPQVVPCHRREPPEDHDYAEVTVGEGEEAVVIGRICNRCATIEPKEVPQESAFTWQGEMTTAVLYIRLNAEKDGYETFRLDKSSPQLKTQIEVDIEQERLRKAEEERRRREEQYREPVPF